MHIYAVHEIEYNSKWNVTVYRQKKAPFDIDFFAFLIASVDYFSRFPS